jgi:hypothetical protein
VALLLFLAVPPAAAQTGPDSRRVSEVAELPENLWAPPRQARANAVGSSSSGDGGWSVPLLLLAVAGAFAAGFVATYGPPLIPGGRRSASPVLEPPPPGRESRRLNGRSA